MQITALYTYPVKSLRGFSLTASELLSSGLRFDRQWMVVDDDGIFLTQRRAPQMALVETAMHGEQLVLSSFGLPEHRVESPDPHTAPRITTKVFGATVVGIAHGAATHEWLSDALGLRCRLLVFARDTTRYCEPNSPTHTLFADGYPLLLIAQESLDDLNARLPVAVDMQRFRPNIVVAGCAPYAEDGWTEFRLGAIECTMARRCARCAVPTVDPATGLFAGPEPLQTLSQYRQAADGKIYFGVNISPKTGGQLRVGEPVVSQT